MGKRSYRASASINAPAASVWALLADADGYADWNDTVISIQGPIREGDTINLVSTVSPKRTFRLRVTRMQAPLLMVWSDGMPLRSFTGERTYSITDEGDGRSEFTVIEEFTGPLARLVTKAIPDLTASFNTFADGLKNAAEAGHAR